MFLVHRTKGRERNQQFVTIEDAVDKAPDVNPADLKTGRSFSVGINANCLDHT